MNDHRIALRLEYLTVGYNGVEAVAAVVFGAAAASIALIGFGLDSIIESLSGFILIWRFRNNDGNSRIEEDAKERMAVRFVGISFLLLGAYVAWESIEVLALGTAPTRSIPGILIAAASIVCMPILAHKKRIIGEKIGSRALIADAKETRACAWLSSALLLGLGLNALFGFWEADPIAGIFIALFLFREGWESVRAENDEDDMNDAGDA